MKKKKKKNAIRSDPVIAPADSPAPKEIDFKDAMVIGFASGGFLLLGIALRILSNHITSEESKSVELMSDFMISVTAVMLIWAAVKVVWATINYDSRV